MADRANRRSRYAQEHVIICIVVELICVNNFFVVVEME